MLDRRTASHPARVASTKLYPLVEPGSRAEPTRFRRRLRYACSKFPNLAFVERDFGANLQRSFLPQARSRLDPLTHGAGQSIVFESALSGFQNADERQVPVPLLVIEAIPDDELISDIKTDVIGLNR
jgi:hypothetical protein